MTRVLVVVQRALDRMRVRFAATVVGLALVSACAIGSECVAADIDEFDAGMLIQRHPTSSHMLHDTVDATERGFQRAWSLITHGDQACPDECELRPPREHARFLPPGLR